MTTRRRLPIAASTQAQLPPLHARWVDGLLHGAAVPTESNATCHDCAMLPGEADDPASGTFFSPETRCCTWLPELANFLVGGILDDARPEMAEGRRTLRERIARGAGLSPLGLAHTAEFLERYRGHTEGFGGDASLRCPHYVVSSGSCSIWAHREATCSTWFCKHTRGAVAKAFWNRLHQLLRSVEVALARHCALELGVGAESLAITHPLQGVHQGSVVIDVTAASDASFHARLWGPWAGREDDYFRACAPLVDSLSWSQVVALAGPEARVQAEVVRHAFAKTQDTSLPPRLTLAPFHVLSINAAGARVQVYSHLDPLDVPDALFRVMRCFRGQPTEHALREASELAGEEVPPGAVRMLLDFKVLTAGD